MTHAPTPNRNMLKRIKEKNLTNWIAGYGKSLLRRKLVRPPRHRHLLFAICDHYEPLWGKETGHEQGLARVAAWADRYPVASEPFRDADGMPPRHSFFFPGEQYHADYIQPLAELAKADYGEVELHLHHDNDTDENLRKDIADYLEKLARHGHISRDDQGKYQYAFIHGNWCLANARADGRWCGVDNEMQLLFDTGCYADYTFPSPEESQPKFVNEFYWPSGDQSRRRAYQEGTPAKVGHSESDRLLMITGPLALAKRPGRNAIRIDTSAIDAGDPASPERVHTWVNQNIHIAGRPEWVFAKIHTHGAPEGNAEVLLGMQGHAMHQTLADSYNDGDRWTLHYVTAREMYNISLAAMDGRSGNPGQYRDYKIKRPPICE